MHGLSEKMPHVAILLDGSYATHSQILRGVLRFTQLHSSWTLDVRFGRRGEPTRFDAANWNATGVIASRMPPDLADQIRRHRTPFVAINDIAAELSPVARISCDNGTIARLAADALAGAGFTSFAFFGERSGVSWSAERERVFLEEIARRGFECRTYRHDAANAAADVRRLLDWLVALPRPTALFAAYDIGARQVLDACLAAGLAVPGDIAILGVDNDEILCETAMPTLSSIPLSAEDAGFRAAELLDAAMAAGRASSSARAEDVFYTGTGVVMRRSTEHDTAGDALVRRCRALIDANIGRPFNVYDLVSSLDVSRRTLEMRFRAATGRSLNDEITDLRIRRAQRLLAKTSLTQAKIAVMCGFCGASHMSAVFRRRLGAKPSSFRGESAR